MPNPQGYFTGHVRAPNKDHLLDLNHARNGPKLRALHARLNGNLPATWDSVALGWVGPIKDQSQCGSCWDFSGTGVVEVAYNKAGIGGGPNAFILSEEYTLDCGRNGGCGGDDNVNVLDWAKSRGLPLTKDYGPYRMGGQCTWQPGMALYKIDDFVYADSNGGRGVTKTEDIKAGIVAGGCVGCAVDAGFNDPGAGVISGRGNNIDHDVILVGWDDSKGRGGAWIMRNSWGTGWGRGGYAYIEYGAYSIGTESVFAVVRNPNPPPSPIPLSWDSL